ncbi:MAG: twin-arginine translocation signal domain-containing protein [Gemmatimonadetes bacterium]|nr:twin-arginine translocation signal domain-containing protein [Gemmatimonadota bacterium]
MTPTRRDFLERLAAGTAAAAGLTSLSPDDLAAISSVQETWDTSWTGRIRGRHKAVFDATEIEDGAGVLRVMIWRMQYGQVLAVAPDDMAAVLVIRHNAIPLAMTQEFWDRYRIGETKGVKHPMTEQPTAKNPALLSSDTGDLPSQFASLNLPGILAAGGIVLACNLAFSQCVGTVAKEDKLEPAAARKRALEMLHPGVILQPSGVFASILAQEHGCRYLKAS